MKDKYSEIDTEDDEGLSSHSGGKEKGGKKVAFAGY